MVPWMVIKHEHEFCVFENRSYLLIISVETYKNSIIALSNYSKFKNNNDDRVILL